MKLLLIIYDSGIDESIDDIVEELDLPGYTKLTGATGCGGQGRKLGSVVWPGTNNILYAALEEERIPPFVARLRQLQADFHLKPAITILAVPVEIL